MKALSVTYQSPGYCGQLATSSTKKCLWVPTQCLVSYGAVLNYLVTSSFLTLKLFMLFVYSLTDLLNSCLFFYEVFG